MRVKTNNAMNEKTRQQIADLLSSPEDLIKETPYFRQFIRVPHIGANNGIMNAVGAKVEAKLPSFRRQAIPYEQLFAEYDPWSHSVLTDENVPCIHVKSNDGFVYDVSPQRMPASYQIAIVEKQTLHQCANPMSHIMLNTQPTDKQKMQFTKIKQIWDERNIDGLKTEAVKGQKSESVVGMLFYHDYKGRIKARILTRSKGWVLISHKDDNGDHILETVYYAQTDKDGNTVRYIDNYDDTYVYRITDDGGTVTDDKGAVTSNGWRYHKPFPHGFSEIPLAVKRGLVAWDAVQNVIEFYERTYNTFMVIQNKYGHGALYVKGKLAEKAKKMAGAYVLNDTSMNPEADAKYLTPPTPQNMIETLKQLEDTIQMFSGTTFILPKDIKISGDTSGLAIQLTKELDMKTAERDINDWQNFANKMMRLFKEGLARELVASGEEGFETAITDFKQLNIRTRFVVWRPQSNEAYNQMLTTLSGAGAISKQTLIEKNTESCPDEIARVQKEKEAEMQEELQKQEETLRLTKKYQENETTVVNE